MRIRLSNLVVGILLLYIAATSIHCGYDGPYSCPTEEDAERVELVVGKYEFYEAFEHIDDPDHFGIDFGEEAYLRVLSDSEVELIFERDGQEVVKKFEVSSRDTVVVRF